ncbi:MAG: hypothetical protein LBS54_09175 [Dysgonamonadaceae bacterium]|jgi:hypothetical protein|nr:hypothetical protein [Dysgonamonadaceae bacterium]
MKTSDFLPSSYPMLSQWLINFVNKLVTLLVTLGIPESEFSALREVISDFQVINQKADSSDATSADRLERKEKAASTKKTVRKFVNKHLRFNDAMTDAFRRLLGLTVPDPEPTPAPPIDTSPKGTVDYSKNQQHTLRVKDSHSSGRAKPEHARGFEVWYKIGEKPLHDSDFLYAGFSSNDHFVIDYSLDQVGLLVSYRFRWKNTRNEPGPWGDVVSAIIN